MTIESIKVQAEVEYGANHKRAKHHGMVTSCQRRRCAGTEQDPAPLFYWRVGLLKTRVLCF